MRPNIHQYMMAIAQVVRTRSTCRRRSVGCVLVDRGGRVLATGYNGVAAGQPHCNEPTSFYADGAARTYGNICDGAALPSGEGHDQCGAIHAEANALVWCREPQNVFAAYVTTAPCVSCMKLLLGTACEEVWFTEDHPSAKAARLLWEKAGRRWKKLAAQGK